MDAILEAFVLVFASLWALWANTTISTLWPLQFALQSLTFTAYISQQTPNFLSKTKNSDNSGLMAGLLLLPLALTTRLLIHEDPCFLVYANSSVYIGLSFLLQGCLQDGILILMFLFMSPYKGTARSLCDTADEPFIDITALLPLAARIVFTHVRAFGIENLPGSFSMGEGILMAQGLTLFIIDLFLLVSARISTGLPLLEVVAARDDVVRVSELAVAGGLLIAWSLHQRESRSLLVFLVGVLLLLFRMLLSTWNPIAWLVSFLDSFRIGLCVFWMLMLAICLPLFQRIAVKMRQIIARKLFHALVVVMFFPAMMYDRDFLGLSYSIAITGFILAECVRVSSIEQLGAKQILEFMSVFVDHREAGRIVFTHTYLLLGCALPLWLSYPSGKFFLPPFAGILALGIGDAMGAVIGSLYGYPRAWINSKSLEGSSAVFISILLASIGVLSLQAIPTSAQILRVSLASILTSIFEASSTQIDNLTLPLLLFTLFNLASIH
uniref:dolichol kinase n=1 Tax=Albugo laibachii Nc14 TaxID=890382 RepID=F0WA52_9STRA|nr:dolichol kinase putative [Albugo laibachii Nc14]|eukprot:CCA18022.1 dolichol kinase putative [Albugo laibachii Nc14]